jgi:hypothetical protein
MIRLPCRKLIWFGGVSHDSIAMFSRIRFTRTSPVIGSSVDSAMSIIGGIASSAPDRSLMSTPGNSSSFTIRSRTS